MLALTLSRVTQHGPLEVAQNRSQAGLWFLVCDLAGAVRVTFLSLGLPMYKAMLCNHQMA